MQNLVGEQIMDVPVPQIPGGVLPLTPLVPQERILDRTRDQYVDVPVPQFKEDGLHLVPQERVLKCTPEQLVDVPVPRITEEIVENHFPATVENRVGEQIVGVPVPQLMEAPVDVLPSTPQECVQNRTQEQIADTPVPQIMEAVVEVFPPTPQVRVQSRTQEQIMDLPVPQIMPALKPYTGKVFTVEMPHQHVHQAYPGDYVVFNIKGLDKHNMPRSGDVMVPASQIQEQIVDVGGTGIVRAILEEQVVERMAGDGRCSSSSSVPWRPELHPSWRQTVACDGSVYLWHMHTRQTQWDPPKDDEGEDEHFDTEDVEEDDARGIGSRFHGSFRPMRLCRVFGAGCCWRGAECSFAHSASELHPLSPDLYL